MRLRNHPLHPIIAIFPLSLLAASVALDVYALATRGTETIEGARWALGVGALAGVIASIPGIADMLIYPKPARGAPLRHGLLNGGLVVLMATGWWLRGVGATAPSPIALAVSAAAVVTAVIAWRIGVRLTPA